MIYLKDNLVAFNTIVYREVQRFLRIWPQTLLPAAVTIILYFVIFGNLIGRQIAPIDGYSYIGYIVPGLIIMPIITNSYSNVVSSFFGSKFHRNIEELLISPTSAHVIVLGYVAGGVLRGLLVGFIVFVLATFFAEVHIHNLALVLFVAVICAIIFALGGLINAIFAGSFDDISIVPSFVLTPLTYLGGVFYSIKLLPEFWQTVSLINPILHLINAFRFGLLGISDISPSFAIIFMLITALLLYVWSIYLIKNGKTFNN